MRHLIRVMRRHDLTNKKDNSKDNDIDKDNDNDKLMKRTPQKSDPRDMWHLIRVMT